MRSIFLLLLLIAQTTAASVAFLPDSRHQQFQTFAFFADEQTGYLLRQGNRAWASFGTSFALLEIPDWQSAPQLIFYGAVHSSFRGKSNIFDFASETMDAKMGFAFEGELSDTLKFSVGIIHFSGHALDGIQDPSLVGPNLSLDQFVVRIIYDDGRNYRLGASIKPVFSSDPGTGVLAGDQFVEVWPFGINPNPLHPTPFVALSADEGGINFSKATFHAQAGVYFGHHTQKERRTVIRFALGYYSGSDPRSKYSAFLNARSSFFYGGILITL